jgi:hypothetical protein
VGDFGTTARPHGRFDAVALMTGLMPLVRKLEARLAAEVEFKGADG